MPRSRPRRPRSTRVKDMTLGDVLFRLALIAPDKYRALDVIIRWVYEKEWPIDDDALLLMDAFPASPQ